MANTADIAALPMYDWPERRSEVDAEWATIRDSLRAKNIPAPDQIIRRNADMPAVPGGIRNADNVIIAPDPATLPPEEFDLYTLWRHPALIYAQTCYGPMEKGLADHVTVVANPDYTGIEGGDGSKYSSSLIMRKRDVRQTVNAPLDGKAMIDVESLKGARFAYNEPYSMSGFLALEKDLTALGYDMSIFRERIATGAHRQSIQHIADGKADLAAIHARSWAMAQTYSLDITNNLAVVGWTRRRPGLPFITANRFAHFFT